MVMFQARAPGDMRLPASNSSRGPAESLADLNGSGDSGSSPFPVCQRWQWPDPDHKAESPGSNRAPYSEIPAASGFLPESSAFLRVSLETMWLLMLPIRSTLTSTSSPGCRSHCGSRA